MSLTGFDKHKDIKDIKVLNGQYIVYYVHMEGGGNNTAEFYQITEVNKNGQLCQS